MQAKPYGQYKPSGVEWLGDVPEHWEVKRVSYVALLKSGESITAEQFEDQGEFSVFGGNGFRGYTDSYTHDGEYALIGRQGALCGNINYGTGKFWASEHAVVVSPIIKTVTKWLGEVLRTMNLNQYSVSAAQPGLSVEIIKALKLPVPPLLEQRAIADFLESKTAVLDELTAKKRSLLERLREHRTALISQAVMKGLPEAEALAVGIEVGSRLFRASGVEWLGDVPEHWEVRRLRQISDVITVGVVVNPSTY